MLQRSFPDMGPAARWFASLLTALAAFAAAAEEPAGVLQLVGPDEPRLERDGPESALAAQRWRSVAIDGGELVVTPMLSTRPSGWQLAETSTAMAAAPGRPRLTSRSEAATLDTAADALFAFRFAEGDAAPPDIAAGRYRSLLPAPMLLQARGSVSIDWRGQRLHLSTTHERRPDGAILAGSMALLATDAAGHPTLLVPPARGMAFARQEIVWAGDLDGDALLDLVVRRTWLTGQVDYLFIVGAWRGAVTIDFDRPERSFSSGAAESESLLRHRSQGVRVAAMRFGSAAFALSEGDWNTKLRRADATRPAVIDDRQLPLGDETVRFTFELVPRWNGEGPSSTPETFVWGGPVVVRAHFRGRSQVIMELGELDGDALRVAVGTVDGRPVVRIGHWPHYNNSIVSDWLWNDAERRFTRLAQTHMQGC